MPIHANTYRHYEGRRRGRFWRAFVIANTASSLAVKKKFLVALILLGIVPSVIFGVLVYGTVSMNAPEYADLTVKMLGDVGWGPYLEQHPGPAGSWRLIFSMFLARWQLISVLVIVTAVGPSLISEDLRARALQLYYSRPLTRVDYLAGKLLVVAVFVAMVTLVPALLLYVVGLVLSRSPLTAIETGRTLFGIVAGCAVTTLVTGALVLACSSLSRRSAYVAVAWASIVILSESAYVLVRDQTGVGWSYLLSIRANVAQTIASLFGAPLEYEWQSAWNPAASWAVLAAVVLVALAFVYRRIGTLEGEH
jgi:ABC-2 type transport system permease protein